MPPDDLERIVDRALKGLPGPRAPRTLMPRVMAAIEKPQVRTSGLRPWLNWPLGWQIASVAALIAIGVGLAQLAPGAQLMLERTTTPPVITAITASVADVASKVAAVAGVTRGVWRGVVQPLVGYALVLVFVMCAACATFGAALGRVALGGVSQT